MCMSMYEINMDQHPRNIIMHRHSMINNVSNAECGSLLQNNKNEGYGKNLTHKILIIDFGSQFTQLIARRIRELSVYCEILHYNTDVSIITAFNPQAIILSGGPESVSTSSSPQILNAILQLDVPILGICYGQQALCKVFGGQVSHAECREFGKTEIEVIEHSELLDGVWQPKSKHTVWMSHSDYISTIPSSFRVIAKTQYSPFAIIENAGRKIYGVQFHPEVEHTPDGMRIIANFVLKIAQCKQNWSVESFVQTAIQDIKKTVTGNDLVLCALSGGCDSTVTAALIHNAIGTKLINVFVDTGLLRQGEADNIIHLLCSQCQFNLIHVDACDYFLSKLRGITDPEQKRKIIGGTFIEIFEEIARTTTSYLYAEEGGINSYGGDNLVQTQHCSVLSTNGRWTMRRCCPTACSLDQFDKHFGEHRVTSKHSTNSTTSYAIDAAVKYLAQGTLYPDVIESFANIGNASCTVTIKSHHNVGGLPEKLALKLIEPLRYLFKDEVRSLGKTLNVPQQILERHPFPGPGLAIRIVGEVTAEKCAILRRADTIYLDEIRRYGLYEKIWQAFVILLPVQSVGVVGDARQYGYVCALRAVTSIDGMTADFFKFSGEFLSLVATRITNEVPQIGRVVYDITSKPPATVEWE